MRHIDEYRDPELTLRLGREIARLAHPGRRYSLMEVCGGHTYAIYRYGLEDFLPENVELVHGPGCPVCVLPMGRVDDAIALAAIDDVVLCSFGDLLRVPGSRTSLLDARAAGADVRVVYSPLDALRLARANPDRQVVFVAIGFETTAPSTALTLQRARAEGIGNFTVFCNHVTIVPPLRAILGSADVRLDGLIGPGHVSVVLGCRPYRFVPAEHGLPVVISGFEPTDILTAAAMLLRQLGEGRAEVENQYRRVVTEDGNLAAQRAIDEVFELRDEFEWRGMGTIARSALALRPAWSGFDAEVRFGVPGARVADPRACQCGEVLRGVLRPEQCRVFGTACTPERPIGTCMVSSEGACAAYYHFGRLARRRIPVAAAP